MRSSLKGIAPEWFTLPGEEGEDEPAQFYLKPLDGLVSAELLMEFYNPATGVVSGPGIIKAFKLGILNWRNIEDADNPGSQLPFSAQAINQLWPAWIMEAGKHVFEISSINEDDSKNSDSPSLSPKT